MGQSSLILRVASDARKRAGHPNMSAHGFIAVVRHFIFHVSPLSSEMGTTLFCFYSTPWDAAVQMIREEIV
jgi:hypothetical protein